VLALEQVASKRIFVLVYSILKWGRKYVMGLNFCQNKFWIIQFKNLFCVWRSHRFIRSFLLCVREVTAVGILVQSLKLLEG